MGFTCAEVSLQYGDGMWLQLTPRIGAFKAFVNSSLFLQKKVDKIGLWEEKTTRHVMLCRAGMLTVVTETA